MSTHRSKIAPKNYVLVDIWNTTGSYPYNCHWAPEISTANIKRELEHILNVEKSWLVGPRDMFFVSTVGAVLNIEEPCDLEAIQELIMSSHHGSRDLCLRIKVGSYPRIFCVMGALFVTIIFTLAFFIGKQWAQNVFYGLVGQMLGRLLANTVFHVFGGR